MSKFEKKFGKYAIHNLTMVLWRFGKYPYGLSGYDCRK